MKKMFLKYKILINGLNIVGDYSIDGFILKRGFFSKDLFELKDFDSKSGIDLNMNLYLMSCITNFEKLSYNYFESVDYSEIDVSDKIDQKNLSGILEDNKSIVDKVLNLEKKLRIILNIPVLFQSITINFYDENMKYIGTTQFNRPISYWNRLKYNLSADEFFNNSRFNMDVNSMLNTKNSYFDRAIEFYNDSFDSDKITNRFILIFSSLEAIFNLDSKNVTEKISKYSAKLLAENDDNEYEKIYKDIKRLYNKRCQYIHGSKISNIKDEDEKLLRRYVRKIIISYWHIIIITKKTPKEILNYLDCDEKLDLQVRLLISAVNSNSFFEQQKKAIDIIEKETKKEIPKAIKQTLLGE